MVLFSLKCNECDSQIDFECESLLNEIDCLAYFCADCKKNKSLKNKSRICPACNKEIISQSPSTAKKAKELGSICKNCRSNQIPQTFTQDQDEFFKGLMLGDGGLVWGKGSLYPRLSISRQTQDHDYLLWQYDLFKEFYDFCRIPPALCRRMNCA